MKSAEGPRSQRGLGLARGVRLTWPALGAVCSLGTLFLPWALSGSRDRSPIALVGALRSSGLALGPLLAIASVILDVLPALAVLAVLAAVVGRRVICAGFSGISGLAVLALALATSQLPGLKPAPSVFVACTLGGLTSLSALTSTISFRRIGGTS